MNIFAVNWFVRGLRGNSVTFALLFATFLLGFSLSHLVAVALTRMGVHWLFVLLLPVLFFGWLSKRENRFIPEESKRKLLARSILGGSTLLALLIHWVRSR